MKSVDVMKCKLVRESEVRYDAVTTPADIVPLLISFGLADEADECFVIVCLATDGSITGIHEISHGYLSGTLVHPREVFKRALLNNAASIILAHNHPSGSLRVSAEDYEVTERLKQVGELLGIEVLDHIIISPYGHHSLKQEGAL